MGNKEIEEWPQELSEILKKDGQERMQELLAFSKKVGASRSHWARLGGDKDATEAQLVDNIQRAIQTASMVDMCRSSATMCETASRNYKIALAAAAIAILSMLAAWVAVLAR